MPDLASSRHVSLFGPGGPVHVQVSCLADRIAGVRVHSQGAASSDTVQLKCWGVSKVKSAHAGDKKCCGVAEEGMNFQW